MRFLKMQSPLGDIVLIEEDGALTDVVLLKDRPPSSIQESSDKQHQKIVQLMRNSNSFYESLLLNKCRDQLNEYFEGQREKFDIPLAPHGTPFQKKVWGALLQIPYGATTSYGRIAKDVSCPKGSRAIGGANGANPIPIIIPCHRVVTHNNKIGGYSSGLDIKVALLNIEGVFNYSI